MSRNKLAAQTIKDGAIAYGVEHDVGPAAGGDAPPLKSRRAVKTPRERYEALVDRRMSAVAKSIAALSRLANRRSYSYTDDERDEIITDLMAMMNSCVNMLNDNNDTLEVRKSYVARKES